MHNYQNYIFDLDGTIVNSSDEVLSCFKKAFKETKYEVDENRFTSDVIGPPLAQIIQMLAPELKDENKINEIMQNYRRLYDYDENDISVMYEGIYELLIRLKEKGYKLFMATFKPKIPTMRLVKNFNLDKIFDDIYTIDKFGKKITKEEMILDIISIYNLEKSQTVMIGDAPSDMIAAKGAGIDCIGVLWGYGCNKTPLKESANHIVSNINEIRKLLEAKYVKN